MTPGKVAAEEAKIRQEGRKAGAGPAIGRLQGRRVETRTYAEAASGKRPSRPLDTPVQKVNILKITACALIAIAALCTIGYLALLAVASPLSKVFAIQSLKPIILGVFSLYVLKASLETIAQTPYTIADIEKHNIYGKTLPN